MTSGPLPQRERENQRDTNRDRWKRHRETDNRGTDTKRDSHKERPTTERERHTVGQLTKTVSEREADWGRQWPLEPLTLVGGARSCGAVVSCPACRRTSGLPAPSR